MHIIILRQKQFLLCPEMNCAEKGIHIEAGRENKFVCLCGNIFCSCAVVVVVVVSLFHDIFSRFVVSVMDALSSVLGAFDEGGVVADAFFPVKGHAHSARATEDARVGAFHVSCAVSWVRLQGFSLALAIERESWREKKPKIKYNKNLR